MALVLLLVLQILSAEGFFYSYLSQNSGQKVSFNNDGDVGVPLFLTPYIEKAMTEEARRLARVFLPGELSDIESYAGFITVDKTYNSNHFVWYFPSENKMLNTTIVWLQGGPGVTSLFGLFDENGAIYDDCETLRRRSPREYWSRDFNVIYIDNPVGTGFSFTEDPRGYVTTQTQIGEQLYETLTQFYKLFPELQNNSLVISGESYGGKYASSLAYTIHNKNPTAHTRGKPVLPLKGVTIGNGWCDPVNQLDYAEYIYQLGLVSFEERNEIEEMAETTRQLIKKEVWLDALESFNTMMRNVIYGIYAVSKYNYALLEAYFLDPPIECSFCNSLNTEDIRKSIHVGNQTFNFINHEVFEHLKEDFLKSVAPWISELLETYKIWFYNGQLDVVVAYPLTVNLIRKLEWSGREDYKKAQRVYYFFQDIHTNKVFLIGISKKAKNMQELVLRGAGHMAPGDQPRWTFGLLTEWCIFNNITEYRGNFNDLSAAVFVEGN